MVSPLNDTPLKEVLFTTVLLYVVSLYEGVTCEVVPGERYTGAVVKLIETIGQQQCVRECSHRPKLCQGVNYRKQELLCELVSAINETEPNPDYVRIALETANVAAGCLSCSTDDLCVTPSSQKVRCIPDLLERASGKPSKQSSTYEIFEAKYAVDGHRGTNLEENNCTHTGTNDVNPWWRVDLQAVYSITSVRILNRGRDINGLDVSDRLHDVTVTVGLTESDINTPCGFFAGPGTLSQLVVINCPTLPRGRFVKISKTTEYLTLCEVDVFGSPSNQ